MSINATTSSATSTVTSSNSSSNVNGTSGSDNAKKSSTDSSFKEEMEKVSSAENKKDKSEDKVAEKNDDKSAEKKDGEVSGAVAANENQAVNDLQVIAQANVEYSKFAAMTMLDVNSMLSNDIAQMVSPANDLAQVSSLSSDFNDNRISMTQSDADFFINLTQNNEISVQNITAQAQNLVNQGVEVSEVKQNIRISEALLEAINIAKENNQPLRIDFDQNVSVILRITKEGVLSANFIPGDKAVEQYLRNNIDSLKATFNEKDLPYSDLSYSNRGKQQQKENRKNKQ